MDNDRAGVGVDQKNWFVQSPMTTRYEVTSFIKSVDRAKRVIFIDEQRKQAATLRPVRKLRSSKITTPTIKHWKYLI
jgi:hypothetical protein